MKMYFSQKFDTLQTAEEDFTPVTLQDSIEKTRRALDIAYAGFDNAIDADMIDSYIYEINALQKRYKHLVNLSALEASPTEKPLRVYSPIRALVSHVFG